MRSERASAAGGELRHEAPTARSLPLAAACCCIHAGAIGGEKNKTISAALAEVVQASSFCCGSCCEPPPPIGCRPDRRGSPADVGSPHDPSQSCLAAAPGSARLPPVKASSFHAQHAMHALCMQAVCTWPGLQLLHARCFGFRAPSPLLFLSLLARSLTTSPGPTLDGMGPPSERGAPKHLHLTPNRQPLQPLGLPKRRRPSGAAAGGGGAARPASSRLAGRDAGAAVEANRHM